MRNRDCLDVVKHLSSASKHLSLQDVLLDHGLAMLGDAYVNFVYSLALSERQHKPVGRKVDSSILAMAVRKSGLRSLLPSRTDRHKQADAAEALIVYAWLNDVVSMEEAVCEIMSEESLEDAFCSLLQAIVKKLKMEKA